ncbi:MAG: hypothetical protein V3R49_04795 [Gammaproteobacteria bacterium]
MSKYFARVVLVLTVLIVNFSAISLVQAMGSKGDDSKSLIVQQSYTWYDGDRERTVWLNSQLVAEFNPHAESRDILKEAYSSAEEVLSQRASIRIWKMGNNVTAKSAIQNLKSSSVGSQYSPVLHDGASASGGMRALPGNIIVHLNPSWDKSLVELWLKNNNLEVVRLLNIGPNILVIKSGAGLVSLDAANKLYESGEVVAAYPDWWKEVVTK